MDIITLAGKFKSDQDLQSYCNAQYEALQVAATKIKALEDEVAHLKSLLVHTAPLESKIEKIQVSDEQAICEMQIQRLKKIALDRELTLEETKKLDLLVKNLNLSKGQSTSIIADYSTLNVQEAKLIELASLPDQAESD